jgi:mono/diheme cytochrome c family protein
MKHAKALRSLAWTSLTAALTLQANAEPVSFDAIGPMLVERCVMCHSGPSAAAGLRLDTLEGLLAGGARGPVVRPGDPGSSELLRRLNGSSQPRMPMTGPPFLSDAEVALFESWIAGGLKAGSAAPSPLPAASRPAAGEPVTYAHVAPLFARHCAKCHSDKGQMGAAPEGYRLTSHAATLSADERARVVPGRPEASELLRRIKGQARPRMPLDGPSYLSADDIQLIETWIVQGARDAEGKPARATAGTRLRLHGTLNANGRLDGLVFSVPVGARIDKFPRPGDYVRLEGRLDASGKVVTERMRRR